MLCLGVQSLSETPSAVSEILDQTQHMAGNKQVSKAVRLTAPGWGSHKPFQQN